MNKYKKNIQTSLKNILTINTVAGHGGAARAAYDMLCVPLRRIGLKTHILCKQSMIKNDKNITIIEKQSYFENFYSKILNKFGYLDLWHNSTKISKFNCYKEANLIHLHNLHGDYFNPLFLPKLTNEKPTIWTLHDEQSFTGHCAYSFSCKKWENGCGNCPDLSYYPSIKKDRTNFLWNLKKKIYENSRLTLVTPSRWLFKKLQNSILSTKKVYQIYNGIDEEIWRPYKKNQARKDLDLPQNKTILLFLSDGSIYNLQKGGKYILNVIDYYKNRKDILILIVGAKLVKEYQNVISIDYIYSKAELVKYYSSADLFIFPTLSDNLPFVVMESMACGTPVISFKIGGIPEEIDHLKTGYLAKYKDLKNFIFGIELFVKNKKLRHDTTRQAHKQFLEKFTLKKCLSNYLDLYKEIYEQKKFIS